MDYSFAPASDVARTDEAAIGLNWSERAATGSAARKAARSAINWSGRVWGMLDLCIASAAMMLAHLVSPQFSLTHAGYSLLQPIALFSASLLFFNYVLGVYDRHAFRSVPRLLGRVVAANVAALAVTSLIFGWIGYLQIGRFIILGTFLLSVAGIFACRMIARELARRSRIRLMFVGDRSQFRNLEVHLRARHSAFYERPRYLDLGTGPISVRRARLMHSVAIHSPDELVVMDHVSVIRDVLANSGSILRSGCGIYSYRYYHEDLLGEVPVSTIDERAVLGDGFSVGSFHTGLVKRPMDILIASVGFLLAAPLMLVCAILVKFTSPGPIIYRQTRVGQYGRTFSIYKFRTMRTDAEANGAVWATSRDSRVTPIGAFLRKSRFDELPQLWNILRGEMSVVGPRPERPEFVEKLRQELPHYDLRHFVPPGLTGWAQVKFRYGATVADAQRKLAFDLYYVRNCSLMLDGAICLRTLAAMAKGAR